MAVHVVHDICIGDFIQSMDLCLHQVKATYSPEIQYITHMYYGPYLYKNIRVDYNNPHSLKKELYHIKHDPNRNKCVE